MISPLSLGYMTNNYGIYVTSISAVRIALTGRLVNMDYPYLTNDNAFITKLSQEKLIGLPLVL